ncbi:MAG: pyridoxal 4-dehydrogenase [Rhizobiales bacterium 65-9]|nr:aldo/keto reductase [Hyphomicrobiales bacterium]OJY32380.1 MAG: pyridoxal 4-dehydrogenase [Rhizobiales bacterium 65-9]
MTLPRRTTRTGLELSILGFGGVPLGGLYTQVSDADARATVAAALAAGVNFIDTAPLYGHGLSEHRIGEALRATPRDAFILSTKVGRLLRPVAKQQGASELFAAPLPFDYVYDYSTAGARRSLEDSLQRLGMARIDMLLIHDVVPRWHGERFEERYREAMAGAYPELARLREDGLVRAIGVGVKDANVCARFARDGDFDCIMIAGQHTLLNHEAIDEFLPLAAEKRIAVLMAAPFNSGVLATGAAEGAAYYYQPAPPDILARVRRIEAVCAAHGVPLAAAALQYPLGHPAVASVVAGARTAQEIEENARLATMPIPPALWADLKQEKLLPAHAPTPTTFQQDALRR